MTSSSKRKSKGNERAPVATRGSGNVFADLSLPHSPEDMAKVGLAAIIKRTIEKKDLTQVGAAALFGTDQAKVSAIVRGRLKDFSLDRLLSYARLLGHDIDVRVSERAKAGPGRMKLVA